MTLLKKKEKATAELTNEEILTKIDTTGMTEDEKEAAIEAFRAEQVRLKFDKDAKFRNMLPPWLERFIGVLLIGFSVFQLYTSIETIQARQLRPIHLGIAMMLVFLLYPAHRTLRRDRIEWYDWILAVAAIGATFYIPANLNYIITSVGRYGPTQIAIGIVGMLLLFEACRRVVGIPIMIVASTFLAYSLFGNYIPGTFGHRGYSMTQVITHFYFTLEGIFGTPIGVSATFIFLFILFGAFLELTGVGRFFIDLANAIAGRQIGGPAKVVVISSALLGTVTGSSVANAVGTGSFTIPAMKKLGYKPEFAGAVEAAASTGGQIMPPVMGAAAFLMAENTGFAYSAIVMSALIPALLYFSGIMITVHHEARKRNLKGLEGDIPKVKDIMKDRGYLLLPLAFMIYMLFTRETPSYSAIGAIISSLMTYSIAWLAVIPVGVMIVCKEMFPTMLFTTYVLYAIGVWLAICSVRRKLGFNPMEILTGFKNGARNVLTVAIACGMAGIIVGTITLTGVGLKFASGLAALSGGNLYLLMFFTMLSCLILGLGMPTTANYLITSTICAPALIILLTQFNDLSAPTMALIMGAHFFCFYFGIIADITPPVALVSMATAAIARSDPFKTMINATRIAIAAFLIPFIFLLNPAILLIPGEYDALSLIQTIVTALIGMYSLSGGLTGFVQDHCKVYERIALIVGGIIMIYPGNLTDIIGLVMLALIFIMQKQRVKKSNAVAA